MSGSVKYMGEKPLLQVGKLPTAAVNRYRFVGAGGDQIGVAGARTYGIAVDEATTESIAAERKIPVTVIGTAALELGDTVGDKSFVMSDTVGRGVPVTAGKKAGAYVEKGGAVGDLVEAFVFVLPDSVASAVIVDPAGGGTVDAEARTAIAAVIDALQAHGIVATA